MLRAASRAELGRVEESEGPTFFGCTPWNLHTHTHRYCTSLASPTQSTPGSLPNPPTPRPAAMPPSTAVAAPSRAPRRGQIDLKKWAAEEWNNDAKYKANLKLLRALGLFVGSVLAIRAYGEALFA